MKRNDIKNMLDGIEDKYLEEAVKDNYNIRNRGVRLYKKLAMAAAMGIFLLGTSVSVLAATNSSFQKWLQSFHVSEKHLDIGKGVNISEGNKNDVNKNNTEKSENIKKNNNSATKYYLTLKYLPKGYKCDGKEGIFYSSNEDTDFFTVTYFHLQSNFTNILPQAKQIEKYQTDSGTAYIATSKYEYRAWLLFDEGDYMLELRDRNKVLSLKEIKGIIDGANLSEEKPSIIYDTLEWSEELQNSYEKALERYQVSDK